MVFRFVGAVADLGDGTKLERFGEAVTLDPARAEELVLQNVPLLSDAEFQSIGFTPAELDENFSTELHSSASPEFLAKRARAWKLLAEYRASLSPESVPAPAAKGE